MNGHIGSVQRAAPMVHHSLHSGCSGRHVPADKKHCPRFTICDKWANASRIRSTAIRKCPVAALCDHCVLWPSATTEKLLPSKTGTDFKSSFIHAYQDFPTCVLSVCTSLRIASLSAAMRDAASLSRATALQSRSSARPKYLQPQGTRITNITLHYTASHVERMAHCRYRAGYMKTVCTGGLATAHTYPHYTCSRPRCVHAAMDG